MAQITLKGNPIHTNGQLPSLNSKAPNAQFTKNDLTETNLGEFAGKNVILNIFPSLDTATCAMSVRKFNQEANQLPETVILCISADLPFAQARFCAAEGLNNVIPLSIFRHPEFAEHYGVRIVDGPLAGLLARAVIILDKNQQIIYSEQVSEIVNEPNYSAALAALNIK
jgi:thiol peroxidase